MKLQSSHAANLAKKTLHLKEVKNAAWRTTEMSSSIWKDSVFMSSPCPNSFHIPQDYNFLNCIKKKKAQSSQVYNLNAKFLPGFTFSSSVLNHWKQIEWGAVFGKHCCSPTNRTSVWSFSADIYALAWWGLHRTGRTFQACCVCFCLILLLNLSGKETSEFWNLIL